jgi:hypothetical protein
MLNNHLAYIKNNFKRAINQAKHKSSSKSISAIVTKQK